MQKNFRFLISPLSSFLYLIFFILFLPFRFLLKLWEEKRDIYYGIIRFLGELSLHKKLSLLLALALIFSFLYPWISFSINLDHKQEVLTSAQNNFQFFLLGLAYLLSETFTFDLSNMIRVVLAVIMAAFYLLSAIFPELFLTPMHGVLYHYTFAFYLSGILILLAIMLNLVLPEE